jgi:hypothetical protein
MAKDEVNTEVDDEAAVLSFFEGNAAEAETEKVEESEVTEEVETEAEVAEVETEAEAEETEADDKEHGSEKVQKRIDKLTARAKSAEERVTELEAKLKETESVGVQREVVTASSKADPLSEVQDVRGLRDEVEKAMAVKRWCIENPDGGTVQAGEKEIDIEAAQARKMLADAEEMITLHVPRRQQFLTEKVENERVARAEYPEMFKSGSDMEKAYHNLLKAWPDVMRFPDYQLVIGDYMRGNAERMAKKAEATKTPTKAKQPLAPPVPKVAAPKPKQKSGTTLSRVAEAGGSEAALAEYFAGA